MRLADVGERHVVAELRRLFEIADPPDDCVRLPLDDGTLLVSTDVVRASTHFPDAMSDRQRGRYAAAVNLSDLAACGAEPAGLLAAWSLPEDLDLATVLAVAGGFDACARDLGCPVLGGDTKPADELAIAGVAIGRADHDGMPWSAAAADEVVAVTGKLGGAGRGLAAWRAGRDGPVLDRLLEPTPRVEAGRALAEVGASACIDLSDGLAASLHRLAGTAEVGFAIEGDSLPRHEDAADDHVLFGGGDFELLCTVPEDRTEAAVEAVEDIGGDLTPIGRVVDEGVRLDDEPLPDRGWEHFRDDQQNQ